MVPDAVRFVTLVRRYSIFGVLLESGAARLLDYLDVEWHSRLAPSLHKFRELDAAYETRLREAGVEVIPVTFTTKSSARQKAAA